ncbi:MAG: hypothetical protein BJ554DRAFT_7546 [Olpidium bornovanus]|uniref:Uncharacterized protein n=1 Tax=Olpidium bornovanus TaxID=278681 RepID=A0A8H7ZVV6_9FUNG|nr:MAG: hypothetical protein BJ554DRAFT_7546 [Olpidium bornovanus]
MYKNSLVVRVASPAVAPPQGAHSLVVPPTVRLDAGCCCAGIKERVKDGPFVVTDVFDAPALTIGGVLEGARKAPEGYIVILYVASRCHEQNFSP